MDAAKVTENLIPALIEPENGEYLTVLMIAVQDAVKENHKEIVEYLYRSNVDLQVIRTLEELLSLTE